MFLNKILGNSEIPTSLNLVSDPLKKNCIESIRIRYDKGIFTNKAYFSGIVVFKIITLLWNKTLKEKTY